METCTMSRIRAACRHDGLRLKHIGCVGESTGGGVYIMDDIWMIRWMVGAMKERLRAIISWDDEGGAAWESLGGDGG